MSPQATRSVLMVAEPDVFFRQAVEADAPALAALHIRAWQWAYRGQLPDAHLDDLTSDRERRTAWWREALGRAASEERTWVAEVAGRIAGFASTYPSQDAETARDTAVLAAIYLDQEVAGRGIGRALLAYAMADLRRRGFPAAILWVLATNERARRFYEAAGWRPDGATRTEQWQGLELHEVRYSIDLSLAD